MNPVVLLDEVDKLGRRLARRSRRRRCSRCSTPRRTTRSATTTWSSTSTSPTCCSSRPRTCSTPSPGRCSTGWRSSRLDGYTEDEKVAIASDHLLPRQLETAGLRDGRARRSPTTRAARSWPATRGRPACAASSAQLGKVLRKAARRIADRRARRRSSSTRPTSNDVRSAGRSSAPRTRPRAGARAWRPVWPSRVPVATCCTIEATGDGRRARPARSPASSAT